MNDQNKSNPKSHQTHELHTENAAHTHNGRNKPVQNKRQNILSITAIDKLIPHTYGYDSIKSRLSFRFG